MNRKFSSRQVLKKEYWGSAMGVLSAEGLKGKVEIES